MMRSRPGSSFTTVSAGQQWVRSRGSPGRRRPAFLPRGSAAAPTAPASVVRGSAEREEGLPGRPTSPPCRHAAPWTCRRVFWEGRTAERSAGSSAGVAWRCLQTFGGVRCVSVQRRRVSGLRQRGPSTPSHTRTLSAPEPTCRCAPPPALFVEGPEMQTQDPEPATDHCLVSFVAWMIWNEFCFQTRPLFVSTHSGVF